MIPAGIILRAPAIEAQERRVVAVLAQLEIGAGFAVTRVHEGRHRVTETAGLDRAEVQPGDEVVRAADDAVCVSGIRRPGVGVPVRLADGTEMGAIWCLFARPSVLAGPRGEAMRAMADLLGTLYDWDLDRCRDPLTGLGNRRLLARLLTDAASGPRAVVVWDLDNLKAINDALGHMGGDRAILRVVDALDAHLGREAVTCRWGGDEFISILRDAVPPDLPALVGRVVAAARGPLAEGVMVGLSAGIARTRKAAPTWEDLVGAADRALLEVKRTAKGGVKVAVV